MIQGTQAYRINAVTQAERKAEQNAAPVYMYWFGWKTPVLDGRPLAERPHATRESSVDA